MDPAKRPAKEAQGRAKAPGRGAPARRPARREEDDGAAVDVASSPSSASSGRERTAEEDEPAEAMEAGAEVAEEGVDTAGETAEVPAVDESPGSGSESDGEARPAKRGRREKPEKKPKGQASTRSKAPAAPSRRQKAIEDEGEKTFERGISLGVKFAVFTAVLVAVCLFALGMNLGGTATREIDRQINEKGVAAAKSFALQPKAILFQKNTEPDSELGRLRDAEMEAWQKSLANFAEKEPVILSVYYTWDDRGTGLVANDQTPPVPLTGGVVKPGDNLGAQRSIGDKDGVEMFEGEYTGAGFSGRVRKYVMKVIPTSAEVKPAKPGAPSEEEEAPKPARGGQPGGKGIFGGPGASAAAKSVPVENAWVHVLIKADEVDVVAAQVRSRILVATGVGIGI